MNIRIGTFELSPSIGSKDRWDLIQYIERERKGTGEKYEDYKEISYSTSLEHALQTIVSLLLSEDETVVSLKEYIDKYLAAKNDIISTVKQAIQFNIQPIKH